MSDDVLEPREANPFKHIGVRIPTLRVNGVEIRIIDLGHGDTYYEVDGLSAEICEQFNTLAEAVAAVEGFHDAI